MYDPISGVDADAAVVERTSLAAGDQVRGPAVIVEEQTTTVLASHHAATMQEDGTVLIHRAVTRSQGVDA
jgi:N-methylhydantoinase A